LKKFIVLFLLIFSEISFSENTIIAIVNNSPVLVSSFENEIFLKKPYSEKIELINAQIDLFIQLEKAKELNILPNEADINKILIDIAKNNNLSTEELLNFDEIESIKKEVIEKLAILNLQRYITKDLEISSQYILNQCLNNNLEYDQKQIKIAQIIISEIDSDPPDPEQKNTLIKSFLNKISTHISKGASFEAFAKLHSQHPSYKDGGVTDWLSVNNTTLKMLDSLGENEVSEIYSTAFGLAIAIKIDERFISSKLVKCEEQVIFKNAENYYAQWLEKLRNEAFIEIYYDKL